MEQINEHFFYIHEMQVHNLILNPEQHSWCELKQLRQIVTHANCESQVSV